jgi:hypothetical protein
MLARIGPVKPFLGKSLPIHVPIRKPESAGRPHGGGGVYRWTSRVSAVMLAGIGPVKPLLFKDLIAHTHAACMRARRRWTAHVQPLRSRCDAGAASAASQAARRGRTGQ